MNKKIFTGLLLTISLVSFAQKPLEILHSKDDMTNKEYWDVSRKLLIDNKTELKAFGVTFHLTKDEAGKIKADMIDAKIIGFKCVENVQFIFMFENDEKITKTSFLKFNCDGNASTWLTPNDINKFSTLKVKKIRVTNGRDGIQITGDVAESDYFMKLLALVNEGKVIDKKE
jgi:hypothetical protein